MSKVVNGKIVAVTHVNTNPAGWASYEIQLDDNQVYKASAKPDHEAGDMTENVGKFIALWEGKFAGKYNVGKVTAEAYVGTPGAGGGSSNSSSGGGERESYWSNKGKYEQEVRDPQIATQEWFAMCTTMYSAALPYLEHPPRDMEALESYMNDCFTQAIALKDRSEAQSALRSAKEEAVVA